MKLKEYEVICPECKGKGTIPSTIRVGRLFRLDLCYECQGSGKLDWIEQVVGKRNLFGLLNDILSKYTKEQLEEILGNKNLWEKIYHTGLPFNNIGYKK